MVFDLTAIVKKKWTLDFCAEIKKRGLKFIWQLPSGTRSEALDSETLTAIYEAGCEYLVYAPESGSEETLVAIPRLIEKAKRACKVHLEGFLLSA